MRLLYISVLIGSMLFLIGPGLLQTASAKTTPEDIGTKWGQICMLNNGDQLACCTKMRKTCDSHCIGTTPGHENPTAAAACRLSCSKSQQSCRAKITKEEKGKILD
ncbi:MAG: hypothetical protein V3T52_04335 [Thermodesulfobacteriota bacterium]|jgi:hypothetical protein